ncbi:hypothetical protein [Terrimonas ferruginea]|uniref:hypothetical protein n=1 Tax=Terrimonas ferruginea TaxID=249 RepID=UPI00041E3DF3|nr:hypothetical protein [Terrimonas ferruginea]
MKKIFLLLLILVSIAGYAQRTIQSLPVGKTLGFAETEGLYLGWKGGLSDPNVKVTGKTLNGRNYTARQIDNSRKFIQWTQASYTPRGCLGIAKYFQNRNPDPNRHPGSTTFYYDQAIPQLYGAFSYMYWPVVKKPDNTFVENANHADRENWLISANQLEYLTTAINCISTPDENFFIMPRYIPGELSAEEYPLSADKSSYLNFDKHPNLRPYLHFVIPQELDLIGGKGTYVVIITKNNQPLPFEGIKFSEFFDRLEKNLPWLCKTYYEHNDYYNNKTPAGALERAQKNLALIRQQYKNRMNEDAYVNPMTDIGFYSIHAADKGIWSPLETKKGWSSFPVLRVKKSAMEACKTDNPQWIAIYWSLNMSNKDAYVHMMESILNNFNFKYVHDYFFGNEKVIVPYKPLRSPMAASPSETQSLPASRQKEAALKNANVLFFDDFSTAAVNSYSPDWNSDVYFSSGSKAKVKEIAGNGKWLELASNSVSPKLKSSFLPDNFSLSFELAVEKGFPYYAKPLWIKLVGEKEESSIAVLQPGSNGNEGFFSADYWLGEGYNSGACNQANKIDYPYYKIPGFSNDKPANKVNIQIVKRGESLQLLANGSEIYECRKAIPGSYKIKGIKFEGGENGGGNNNFYYLGNVKIERL